MLVKELIKHISSLNYEYESFINNIKEIVISELGESLRKLITVKIMIKKDSYVIKYDDIAIFYSYNNYTIEDIVRMFGIKNDCIKNITKKLNIENEKFINKNITPGE